MFAFCAVMVVMMHMPCQRMQPDSKLPSLSSRLSEHLGNIEQMSSHMVRPWRRGNVGAGVVHQTLD